MIKRILRLGILLSLLNACVPSIIVDTKGRSGTFDKSNAEELTNDRIICNQIVKENVNLTYDYSKFAWKKYIDIAPIGLIKADELKAKKIKRNCLKGRGHSTLD